MTRSILPLPFTRAKSLTRRSKPLAIRGVPRLRRAISKEASSVISMRRMAAERFTNFFSNNISKRCFSQSRRAMQQYMIHRFLPLPGSTDKDVQVVDHLFLPGKIFKALRPQNFFKLFINGGKISRSGVYTGIGHERQK